MCGEDPHQSDRSTRPFQFSVLALLGVVTGCGVVLGMVAWLGPDLVAAFLMIGGFLLVLVGTAWRRDRLAVCGGVLMMAACAILVVLGVIRAVLA